jgi:hypothetical protein
VHAALKDYNERQLKEMTDRFETIKQSLSVSNEFVLFNIQDEPILAIAATAVTQSANESEPTAPLTVIQDFCTLLIFRLFVLFCINSSGASEISFYRADTTALFC